MAHDVFISHSSKDKAIADGICAALEAIKIRCWIAPRDINSGDNWAEAVTRAIKSSSIMVLIFSKNSNQSKQVANELTLAVNSGLIVIPFKIDDILPSGVMEYYLSGTHWLDAINPPIEKQVYELVEITRSIMNGKKQPPATSPVPDQKISKPEKVASAVRYYAVNPVIIVPVWFWIGVLLLFITSIWAYAWIISSPEESSLLFAIIFLNLVVLPLLIPAVYCIRRGMMGKLQSIPAALNIPGWWWALPAFFGFAGGFISWIKYKNINKRTALDTLILGIILTPSWVMFYYKLFF